MNVITFKTKTGFCHILPDKIILSRDGVIGNVAEVAVGNNISRVLLIYGSLILFLIYSAFRSFLEGHVFIPVLYVVFGLFLMIGIFKSRNNSAVLILERSKIKEIKLKKGIYGITRSRFVVLFKDDKGNIKKRLIMLPGSMLGGQNETKKAIKIMIKQKLLQG